MNKNLFDVTRGERLWMWRMSGPYSLESAAARCGVDVYEYETEENDEWASFSWGCPPHAPTRGDLCRLARRRMGWTVAEAEKQLNYDPGQLEIAESNDDFLLLREWVIRGFRFIPEEDMIAAFKRSSEPENEQ